jgi:hypothetical protein
MKVGIEVTVTLGALGLALAAFFALHRNPVAIGPRAIAAWFGSLAVVAVVREVIRSSALAEFGYRVADYPFRVDWGSVAMFGVTSVVGVSIIVYLVLVLYQAGLRSADQATISLRVDRFGRVATGMLGAWFGFFLLVGLYAVLVLK